MTPATLPLDQRMIIRDDPAEAANADADYRVENTDMPPHDAETLERFANEVRPNVS